MFPLFIDLTDRLAVVVGGGPVGRRKATALVAAGARVRLVCLEPRPADAEADVDWLHEPYSSAHLEGASLAFAAASAEVNACVVADARASGVWVNSASDPAAGDFHVPATLRPGPFVLAVSTGGAAPALARAVCTRLEKDFDDAFAAWVALLAELRSVVLERVRDADRRRELFEGLAHWGWLERLKREGAEAVRQAMLAEVGAKPRGGAPPAHSPCPHSSHSSSAKREEA